MTHPDLHWRTSSFTASTGTCVELAIHPAEGVLVRNSNKRHAGTLTIEPAVMAHLITAARTGHLDPLT